MERKIYLDEILIIPCSILFANIWKPKKIDNSAGIYFLSGLFPKDDKETVGKVVSAIEKLKKENSDINITLPSTLRDGDVDRPEDNRFTGMFYINTSTKERPEIIDSHRNTIYNPQECVSGDFCNVGIKPYIFVNGRDAGISAELKMIQKL